MTPPIWLDEARRPCPTYPCAVCGRETPLFRLHGRHLWRDPAWLPFRVEAHPSWCGHPVPRVYVPMGGGWCQAGPVIGSRVAKTATTAVARRAGIPRGAGIGAPPVKPGTRGHNP